jgi:crotonobetainyl-CoA:carnitine CoA-transferase CaiB-like acyl-CoA transferase
MPSPPQNGAPLRGLRVLDFTMNLPGPYTAMILCGLGAEVIKIEPPRGDVARGFSRLFGIVNAGKKSVVLDLKADAARPQLHALVRSADVIVDGFRPGVMARLGAGPEEARQMNPRLVYCSISGYGQTGPYRDDPGHDLNYQALTGVCHMMRDGDDRPLGAALPIADLSAAMTASTSVLAALYERERTGVGRAIDVAMVDALLSWAYVWAEGLTPSDARLSAAIEPTQNVLAKAASVLPTSLASLLERTLGSDAVRDRVDAVGERLKDTRRYKSLTRLRLYALPHYACYQTKDGRWLSVAIVDEDKFWRALCEALGVGPLGGIPMLGRFVAASPLRKVLASVFAKRDLATWLAELDRREIPVAPVLTVEEALRDPQLLGRRPTEDGHVHSPWPLMGPIDARAPALGEHTDEVLGALTLPEA